MRVTTSGTIDKMYEQFEKLIAEHKPFAEIESYYEKLQAALMITIRSSDLLETKNYFFNMATNAFQNHLLFVLNYIREL